MSNDTGAAECGGGACGRRADGRQPDLSSFADLANSFEVVTEMRLVPFTIRTVLQLAVVTLLPVGRCC